MEIAITIDFGMSLVKVTFHNYYWLVWHYNSNYIGKLMIRLVCTVTSNLNLVSFVVMYVCALPLTGLISERDNIQHMFSLTTMYILMWWPHTNPSGEREHNYVYFNVTPTYLVREHPLVVLSGGRTGSPGLPVGRYVSFCVTHTNSFYWEREHNLI